MRLILSAVVALILLAPIDGEAQASRRFTVTPVSPLLQPDRDSARDPEPYPTYRREGGLLGAILLGIAAAFITYKVCDGDQDGEGIEEGERCTGETFGLGMAGAVVGFFIGSKIGGGIEKAAPSQ